MLHYLLSFASRIFQIGSSGDINSLLVSVLLCLDSVSCYLPVITRGIPTRTHRTDRHPSRFAELLCFRGTLPNIERKQKPDYQRGSNTTICGQLGCLRILQRLGSFARPTAFRYSLTRVLLLMLESQPLRRVFVNMKRNVHLACCFDQISLVFSDRNPLADAQ